MITLTSTDQFGITIPQVSVLTGLNILTDRHANLINAQAVFTQYENAAAYVAGVSNGMNSYNIGPLMPLLKSGQATLSYTSIETYLMGDGQPFAGATQTITPTS